MSEPESQDYQSILDTDLCKLLFRDGDAYINAKEMRLFSILREGGIKTIADLSRAIETGTLLDIKYMGMFRLKKLYRLLQAKGYRIVLTNEASDATA